jgi:DNA-binding transcriptional regulator YdaS (Cro superfamily)
MRANGTPATASGRPTLRLRTDEFDKLAAAVIGAPTNKALAERLGMDEAHLSQLRNHRRTPGEKFIAACKTAMPNVTFEQLFEIVEPVAASDAA